MENKFDIRRLMKKIFFCLITIVICVGVLPLSAFAIQETESNNTMQTATTISLNSTASGNLSASSDIDWFQFTLPQDGYISIQFNHDKVSDSDDYWRIRVYQSDAVTYVDNVEGDYTVAGNSDRTLPTMGLCAGTYYIRVAKGDYDHSTNNYSVTVNYTENAFWETEINNAKNTADVLELNTKYYGSLSSSSDVDWFQFILPQDGYISIAFNHDKVSDSDDYWRLRIYQSDGVTYYNNVETDYTIAGNEDRTLPTMGLPAGTYYVRVVKGDYDHSFNNYNIAVNFTENNYWETEINNGRETADSVELNTTYFGSLSASSDVDWYKIILPSNGYISITFNHDKISDSDDYWRLRVYQSDGVIYYNNVETDYTIAGNEDRTLPDMGLPAGTYYIRIAKGDYDSSTNNYNFIVNFTESNSWETEINNTKDTANIIKLNNTYQGALSASSDVDWYKLTLSSSADVSIVFNHAMISDSDDYWRIYVYESDGVTGHGENSVYKVLGNENAEFSDIQFSSGTYYLKVVKGDYDNSILTYSLSVLENHDCVGKWEVTTSPTCTEDGVRDERCTKCGKVLNTESISALGHVSDNWTEVKKATCTEVGYRSGTCSRCNEYVDETVEMLSHEYGDWEIVSGNKLIPPIVEERACALCGATETRNDWSNIWITIVAGIAAIGVLIGVINYIRAFKKKR